MSDRNSKRIKALKQPIRCRECGIETYQRDRYCVICKIGIREVHEELCYLFTKDKNWGLLQKIYDINSK